MKYSLDKGSHSVSSLQFHTYPQQPGFQITPHGLKLSKIGTIKIKLHRSIPITIKTCTIKREIDKWYACFVVDYAPITTPIPENAVGIDVGINSFAVLSKYETNALTFIIPVSIAVIVEIEFPKLYRTGHINAPSARPF